MKYHNPILSGFYPDPSICRVGDTYYLVCSSFQYFPGVPLFESKNLINWEQIGHVLTRPEQLPLKGADGHGGIYAPTIRYHEGIFYMITTNCNGCGNFLVWTKDIHGEWSDPVPLASDGIDPSLYFEGDHCYFMRNHSTAEQASILQYEINPMTGEKLSEEYVLWHGNGGRYLEAPHLYKINHRYYLMAAEGGTEYGHMEVYAMGDNPNGPFVTAPNNPVLTNRNIGDYQLQGVGHGDLVEDTNGNWWMVHLAFRQMARWCTFHHIGRETCLVPVTFLPDGTFVAGDEKGISRLEIETDRISESVTQTRVKQMNFQNTSMGQEWCWLRNPDFSCYDASDWKKNELRIKGSDTTLDQREVSNSFLGIRQTSLAGTISVEISLENQYRDNDGCSCEAQDDKCTTKLSQHMYGESGITCYMDQENHYDLGITQKAGRSVLYLRKRIGDMDYIAWEHCMEEQELTDKITLHIDAKPQQYLFSVQIGEQKFDAGTGETRLLSSEVAGGFTGVMIGLYVQKTTGWTTFRNFNYTLEEEKAW